MVAEVRQYSIEEYWTIANLPENEDKRFELVEGEIEELAPSSTENTVIANRFAAFLFTFVEEHHLGFVSGTDGGFRMVNGNVRLPDVGFISKELDPTLKDKVFPIAPDLAVEVVSEHDSATKVRNKVQEYLASGTKIVCTIYSETKSIDVYRRSPDGSVSIRILDIDEVFDGEDVIPGFHLPVRKIFPE